MITVVTLAAVAEEVAIGADELARAAASAK
jgi:hypothetical protein